MGAKQSSFKRKLLASSISSCILATVSAGVSAQDTKAVDEVVVTGIRASLAKSVDMKREAVGVVDAINAEDIGKMPDTNLAESLQRITGVSISRNNGEGSQVTVRGFGAQYNMVTLNGRVMPGGGASGGGDNIGRAFDFGNLASESVRGLEVYKTGKANITTGGIGATVNINTTKPILGEGFKATVVGKGTMDSTNRTGSDITPDLSTLLSYTTDANTFGVSLTASHQVRDSGNAGISVSDWRVNKWSDTWNADKNININNGFTLTGDGTPLNPADDGVITNRPQNGKLFAMPNDVRYNFEDNHNVRDNAQLTVQFKPTDALTATADYTYANNTSESHRGQKTAWMTRVTDTVTFDSHPDVATAVLISEDTTRKDLSFAQSTYAQKNTLSSLGVNLELAVNDSLTLKLDGHNSTMDSKPDGGEWGGFIAMSIATPVGDYQNYDFNNDIPIVNQTIRDVAVAASAPGVVPVVAAQAAWGNGDGIWNEGDLGTQYLQVGYSGQKTDITQIKLDGLFEFDNGHLDFGVETRSIENHSRKYDENRQLGDWGVSAVGDVPGALIESYNLLSDLPGAKPNALSQTGFKGDAEALARAIAPTYKRSLAYSTNWKSDELVEEDTLGAYFQVAVETEVAGKPANILAGLRYETTDTKSISYQRPPTGITWTDNNDYTVNYSNAVTPRSGEASYDNFLPSIDFDIAVTDDLKARASFGQTIARASYDDLRAGVSGFAVTGPTPTGGKAAANGSNPELIPLLSNNVDLSLEWYFNEDSYVSGGFYEKRVQNFIGNTQTNEKLFGLRDASDGPRARAAQAALKAINATIDETTLFVMTAVMSGKKADGTPSYPGCATGSCYVPGNVFAAQVAKDVDLEAAPEDAEFNFLTTRPTNNKDAKIYGLELAGQYFFGDTGLGVQANYTTVNGDIKFDNAASPTESQFALIGLSDTANLVLIYEGFGFESRLAYNWRDQYLTNASKGESKSPEYVEAYSQIDLSVSYEVMEGLNVFAEGLNLAGEDARTHARTERQVWSYTALGPRYQLGARYSF